MNIDLLINLSAIIDKMGINTQLEKLEFEQGNAEELGTKLIVLLATNLYKAKDEIYTFVMEYKGCSLEDAKKVNIIEMFKELKDEINLKDFLA